MRVKERACARWHNPVETRIPRGEAMRRITLALLLTLLAACQTATPDILVVKGELLQPTAGQTFAVSANNTVPRFLVRVMTTSAAAALSQYDMNPVTESPDLLVELGYEQEDISASATTDPFSGRIVPGGYLEFMATITVRITDAETGDEVYAGAISRLHAVEPGESMHVGKIAADILESFRDLFTPLSG